MAKGRRSIIALNNQNTHKTDVSYVYCCFLRCVGWFVRWFAHDGRARGRVMGAVPFTECHVLCVFASVSKIRAQRLSARRGRAFYFITFYAFFCFLSFFRCRVFSILFFAPCFSISFAFLCFAFFLPCFLSTFSFLSFSFCSLSFLVLSLSFFAYCSYFYNI